MVNFKKEWQQHLRKDLGDEGHDATFKRLEKKGLFDQWDRCIDPAPYEHLYAIDILCGDSTHPYAQKYLDYAQQIIQRAVSETNRWLPTGDWGRPNGLAGERRGEFLAAKAYTEALKANLEPNRDELVEGARAIIQDCLNSKGKLWDEIGQGSYLLAVQMLLIAGAVEEAQQAMKTKKSFKRSQIYFDWMKEIVFAIPLDGDVTEGAEIEKFDQFFDVVRDPNWKPPHNDANGKNVFATNRTKLRLQLALIRQRYIVGKPIEGHWIDVIEHISR